MNTIISSRLLTGLGLAALLPLCAQAQTIYINETFETDTLAAAPTDSAQIRVAQTTVVAGSGLIGTDQVAHFNDTSATTGGSLEYNVGGSALGSLQVSFDILNNAANPTGTAANPIIFGFSKWDNVTTSTTIGSNANRFFGLEIYQTGLTSTVRIRVGSSAVHSGVYDMAALINVSIFVNDHDTNTLDYLLPGTSTTATLNANSAVVFLNNSLVGTETSVGFVMQATGTIGNSTGNTNLGRLGFNSGSAGLENFLIDNLLVSSVAAVPEPSTYAALAGLGVLGLAFTRRQRRA